MSKSLITYHVTLHDEKDFKGGIWPLTHFGPPAMGVWQTISKNIGEILKGDITLKVIEAEIGYEKKIKTEDSGTSNIWGFLLALFKAQGLKEHTELAKIKELYKDTFKTEEIHNSSVRTREARIFAANICLENGYDLSFYENTVENKAIDILKDFPEIPKISDDTCYINIIEDQIRRFDVIEEINRKTIDRIISKIRDSDEIFNNIYLSEIKNIL